MYVFVYVGLHDTGKALLYTEIHVRTENFREKSISSF